MDGDVRDSAIGEAALDGVSHEADEFDRVRYAAVNGSSSLVQLFAAVVDRTIVTETDGHHDPMNGHRYDSQGPRPPTVALHERLERQIGQKRTVSYLESTQFRSERRR